MRCSHRASSYPSARTPRRVVARRRPSRSTPVPASSSSPASRHPFDDRDHEPGAAEVLAEEPLGGVDRRWPRGGHGRKVDDALVRLLAATGRTERDVRGVGVGVPGPSSSRPAPRSRRRSCRAGTASRSASGCTSAGGVPALVDNDVNLMAWASRWAGFRDYPHMLFVKVGTGIGCGIITDGRIHRGALGSAGDIGHIRVPEHDDVLCHCGNQGCLEAVAGGAAMARVLDAEGIPTKERPRRRAPRPRGPARAMQVVRQAARARRGARRLGQLLQPGDHRHRRRHRPRRRAPLGRRARAGLPARGAARHPVAAHRALPSSTTTAASSAPPRW